MADAAVIRVGARVVTKIGEHWDKTGFVSQISKGRACYLVSLDTGEIAWFNEIDVRLEVLPFSAPK